MKIIVACDSFKGSLSSQEAGEAVRTGIYDSMKDAEVEVVAVADGGEGTSEVLINNSGAKIRICVVTDPLGGRVKARYGIINDMAIIDMAQASGLTLVPVKQRNPVLSTSYGTGELIADALAQGCRKFLIGIGGSATNDAGIGMLRALGYEFYDSQGKIAGITADTIHKIRHIDKTKVNPALSKSSFLIACDVDIPLTGTVGATYIFGPQKGLSEKMVPIIDENIIHFSAIVTKATGKDYSKFPGAGAAGGIGFAFITFLDATLMKGIELVLDFINFDKLIADAALIITGEGRIDSQTGRDKAPLGILRRARQKNIPVIAVGGCTTQEGIQLLKKEGIAEVLQAIQPGQTIEEAMQPEMSKYNIRKTISEYFDDKAEIFINQ